MYIFCPNGTPVVDSKILVNHFSRNIVKTFSLTIGIQIKARKDDDASFLLILIQYCIITIGSNSASSASSVTNGQTDRQTNLTTD